jgi:hypothetical protein
MRRARWLAALLVVLVALSAHILYWYVPRERPAVPDPSGLPARLMGSGAYDACFWVPYPHQNVGALSALVEDGSAWLEAAARVAGVPAPVLPSFGPFALPPSREVVVCSDLDGKRFQVAAQVYPLLGAVARLSGSMADNPWLAGGDIREVKGEDNGNAVVEQTVKVAWKEGVWTVSSGAAPALDAPGSAAPLLYPASLGIVRLEREISDFPDGDYLLRRRDGDLELALRTSEAPPQVPDPTAEKPRPVLLAVAGASWPPAEAKPLPPSAFALFELDPGKGIVLGPFGELPGAAVFYPPDSQRWKLPAEGLSGLVAGSLPKGGAAGWEIKALDGASLRRSKRLAQRLTELVPPDATTALNRDNRLVLGLWVEPGPALQLVARFRKVLEKVPLVDREQLRSWRDWEILLDPIAPCDQVTVVATQGPPSFRMRFHHCG